MPNFATVKKYFAPTIQMVGQHFAACVIPEAICRTGCAIYRGHYNDIPLGFQFYRP